MDIAYLNRVKSGNFGQRAISDIHLQTAKIQMRRHLMSRLIRIFTIGLVNKFLLQQARCPNLIDCPNLPDFTI